MKLYTEEQVREAFDKGYKYAQRVRPASIEFHYQYVEGEINSLNHIELPSDDEICDEAESIAHNYFVMQRNHYQGLEEGAKRMAYWLMKNFKKDGE